jgi:hypothetical protein
VWGGPQAAQRVADRDPADRSGGQLERQVEERVGREDESRHPPEIAAVEGEARVPLLDGAQELRR